MSQGNLTILSYVAEIMSSESMRLFLHFDAIGKQLQTLSASMECNVVSEERDRIYRVRNVIFYKIPEVNTVEDHTVIKHLLRNIPFNIHNISLNRLGKKKNSVRLINVCFFFRVKMSSGCSKTKIHSARTSTEEMIRLSHKEITSVI